MIENLYHYRARVQRVVDGDTLDLVVRLGFDVDFNVRVRLYGIDTPETRTKDAMEKEAGLKAMDFVKTMVEGRDILVETRKDSQEKFGRYLAIVFYAAATKEKWVNLNDELVANGMAKPYSGGKRE